MRAIVYSELGPSGVLRLVERDAPVPGRGEVLVSVAVSGVNPTDWKARRGSGGKPAVPGAGAEPGRRRGDRRGRRRGRPEPRRRAGVAVGGCWQRADGTAQEQVDAAGAPGGPLPEAASFDLGREPRASRRSPPTAASPSRSAGLPAWRPARSRANVLVAGGAGAVGHAAIQLARWSGAAVTATVSSGEKGELALAAGAQPSSTTARTTPPTGSARSPRAASTSSSSSHPRQTRASTARCSAPRGSSRSTPRRPGKLSSPSAT